MIGKTYNPYSKKNKIILGLDYDGTLTPIAVHPSLAHLDPEGEQVLSELANSTDNVHKVVVISGRELRELRRFVGFPSFYYIGNHGFEVEGPFIHYIHPEALETKTLMEEVQKDLELGLRDFHGTFVENKIFTLSVHYRQLAKEKTELAKQVFNEILRPYEESAKVVLTEGRKVWEVRPAVEWNKGSALAWLLERWAEQEPRNSQKALKIYIGDDQTDEDVFKNILPSGIGIKVTRDGNEASSARYYLHSPDEVFEFLKRLNRLKIKKEEFYAGR